jgi:hypothetical protein
MGPNDGEGLFADDDPYDFDEYEDDDGYCNCSAIHDDTELGGLCSACGGICD